MTDVDTLISDLLNNPDEKLLKKEPFYRGITQIADLPKIYLGKIDLGKKIKATIPNVGVNIVTESEFAQELDVYSHSVLFDDNVPCLTFKGVPNKFQHDFNQRIALPIQKRILKKQVQHLCGNKMCHILLNTNPSEKQKEDFITIKQYWDERNIDGTRTQAVLAQKSFGDMGWLFYHDHRGRIRSRVVSFENQFRIISHKDDNGDHILECLYYEKDKIKHIDCYDDKYIYRLSYDSKTPATTRGGWSMADPELHGFSECPLITKRGPVAWNDGQPIIEVLERTLNTFVVIQNRYGQGILYIKGKILNKGKRVAGAIVLNDTNPDSNGSAEFKAPPTPDNMVETIKTLKNQIEIACGTTFLLPEDIKISGDTSGVAIQLTQEMDIETANQGVIDWQNVASKAMRLFKEGLAKELYNSGDKRYETAITDFKALNIQTSFVVWRPQSNAEYNQMLVTLKGAGGISTQTLVEKNTESAPDENARLQNEREQMLAEQLEQQKREAQINKSTSVETIETE